MSFASLFYSNLFTPYFRNDLDDTVYIGNVPTGKATDVELLEFFQSFGKVLGELTLVSKSETTVFIFELDIRVFKDHVFVQFSRLDAARKLLSEGQLPLIFKEHHLDVRRAREVRSIKRKSSSKERSSTR